MGWQIEALASPLSVKVADGNDMQVYQYCKELEWLLQGTVFKADFLLLPLGTSDMVLGVQWLCTLGRSTGDIKFNFSD